MSLLDADVPSSPSICSNSAGSTTGSTSKRKKRPMPRKEAGNSATKPTLFLRAVMDEPTAHSCAEGTAFAFSRRSPSKQTPNEDAAAVIPLWDKTAVLAVADGVGGMKCGDKASAAAIRALRKSVSRAKPGDDLRKFILDGIERGNENIMRNAGGSATTLAVVEISNGYMRPYHIGDSIILQVSPKGDVKWSALSHAPVSYAVEAGVLTEADAMLHPDRNLISNVVGDREMRIAIGPRRKLAAQDTLVVASDGLCDNLSSMEIADFSRRSPMALKVSQMIATARMRMELAMDEESYDPNMPGKPDDLTLLVYRKERRKRSRAPKKPAAAPAVSPPSDDANPPAADRLDQRSLVADYK